MNRLLAVLQEEVESLILRLASKFPGRRDQLLFLINNYDVVMSLIIQNFSADWKKSLDLINGEIMTSFPNLKLGTGILQQSLTQLVQYYHRFSRVLGVPPLSQIPAAAQLINIHQLMVEVKKYKPSF